MAENRGMPARGPMRGPGAGAAMSDSKPKEFKKSIAKLGKYLKAYWIGIIVALVFAVLGTVLSIFAPKILQLIGNEIVEALGADVPIDMASFTSQARCSILYSPSSCPSYRSISRGVCATT